MDRYSSINYVLGDPRSGGMVDGLGEATARNSRQILVTRGQGRPDAGQEQVIDR